MLKSLWREFSGLSFNKLVSTLTTAPKAKPADLTKVAFGSIFSDHMLEIDWNEEVGWKAPEIKPYQNLILDPSSSVFHYCTECYEGYKVYYDKPHILTFRPHANMERFKISARAAGLPEFDHFELLKCIDELIRIDKDWVPQTEGYSLYVRPNMIGTHAQLGVVKPKSAKIVVILSPVGPYFPTGYKPISLYCEDTLVRAWPGGHGNRKIGGNYAPGIIHAENVRNKGYGQILWLSEGNVTESGVMNFFVLWKKGDELELITSPINHTVLPGITRDSVLQISREWGLFKVTERNFKIDELIEALEQGNVVEAFGTGTAAVICPVNLIAYKGKDYEVPAKLGNFGEITKKILDELLGIQYGKIRHKWNHYIA